MRSTACSAILLTVLVAPVWAARGSSTADADAVSTTDAASLHRRITREGVAIDVTLEPVDAAAGGRLVEGDDVRVRLEVTDIHTGSPMTTLFPAAWMDRLPAGPDEDPKACQTKVEGFLSGSLLSVPDLDLNVYYVLAMNNDGTISVVDPLFGFGGSKLLTMVFLESPGEDWAISSDHQRLFVSMPRSGKIAVVDTATWKVIRNVAIGSVGRASGATVPAPTRLELQNDERFLWVTWEADGPAASGVSVLDTASLEEVARIETGRGRHFLSFDERGRYAFVTNELDGTVTVIDARSRRRLHDVEVGGRPISIDYSPVARTAWVAGAEGTISAIDGERLELAARLEGDPGLVRIRFAPGGRFAFAPNPVTNNLAIVDAARRRIVQTGEMESGPDDVAFSDRMAYVRHRDSDLVLMIPLDQIGGEGDPIPVIDIPGGKHPAGQTSMPSSAETIVRTPGATAVLIANPLDEAIYFYKEGMAAPMGHFQNYGRQPRAVRVVDRSLRETSPGVYETTVKLRGKGLYDVAVFVDSPRVIHCFEADVAPNPELAKQAASERRLNISIDADSRQLGVGETVKLRVRVHDAETGAPRDELRDVDVVAFLSPGIWQQRQWARFLGDGLYEVELTPPKSGVYYVFVEIPSERLRSNQSPSLILQALEAQARKESKNDP